MFELQLIRTSKKASGTDRLRDKNLSPDSYGIGLRLPRGLTPEEVESAKRAMVGAIALAHLKTKTAMPVQPEHVNVVAGAFQDEHGTREPEEILRQLETGKRGGLWNFSPLAESVKHVNRMVSAFPQDDKHVFMFGKDVYLDASSNRDLVEVANGFLKDNSAFRELRRKYPPRRSLI